VTPRQLEHPGTTFEELLGDAPFELQTVTSVSRHDEPFSIRPALLVQSYLPYLSSFWGSLQLFPKLCLYCLPLLIAQWRSVESTKAPEALLAQGFADLKHQAMIPVTPGASEPE
jgi:hypothetical protein